MYMRTKGDVLSYVFIHDIFLSPDSCFFFFFEVCTLFPRREPSAEGLGLRTEQHATPSSTAKAQSQYELEGLRTGYQYVYAGKNA